MLDNIKLGQFLPGESWYYRLDPRTKLMITIAFIVLIFLANNWLIYSLVTLFTLGVLITSGISLKFFYRSIKPIIFLMMFTFILNIFFIRQGTLLLEFWFLEIYDEGLKNAFFIVLRLILIVSFTSLLTFTTKPTDLTNGLESIFKPFKIIGLPAAELALMISISLRFIPTLLDEMQKIMKAQSSRGADFTEGKLKDKVVQIISLLIPMFIISFKRAEDLANTMEARGYIPGKKRSRLNQLKYHFRDYAFMISMVLLVALVISGRIYINIEDVNTFISQEILVNLSK